MTDTRNPGAYPYWMLVKKARAIERIHACELMLLAPTIADLEDANR